MSRPAAVIAAQRFGYGPKPGELAAIEIDPKGWLLSQIIQQADMPTMLAARPALADRIVKNNRSHLRGSQYNQPQVQIELQIQLPPL